MKCSPDVRKKVPILDLRSSVSAMDDNGSQSTQVCKSLLTLKLKKKPSFLDIQKKA
jgi:hypothetical protein